MVGGQHGLKYSDGRIASRVVGKAAVGVGPQQLRHVRECQRFATGTVVLRPKSHPRRVRSQPVAGDLDHLDPHMIKLVPNSRFKGFAESCSLVCPGHHVVSCIRRQAHNHQLGVLQFAEPDGVTPRLRLGRTIAPGDAAAARADGHDEKSMASDAARDLQHELPIGGC